MYTTLINEKDIVGKVATFDIYGIGSYEVLIDKITPTGFHGLILYFNNAYSGVCVPDSIVPLVEYTDVHLDDPEVLNLRFRNATYKDRHFADDVILAQNRFLQRMIGGNEQEQHVYQSLTFNITDVLDSNIPNCRFDTRGTYCDMEIENLLGVHTDSKIKNPYVVKMTYNADDFYAMCTAYDRYVSAAGLLQPDTIITYNINSYSKVSRSSKGRKQLLCSISVPYETLKEKGKDVFPVVLPQSVKTLIEDSIVFMQKNKQLWLEQAWAHKDTKQDAPKRS